MLKKIPDGGFFDCVCQPRVETRGYAWPSLTGFKIRSKTEQVERAEY